MVKRFAGVDIYSKDPEKLALFYQKLGIPILSEHPAADDYDGVELGFDGRKAIIWIWNREKWAKEGMGTVSLTFNCDDLDQTYVNLQAHGIQCDAPFVASWGGREIRLRDPEGNHIVIIE